MLVKLIDFSSHSFFNHLDCLVPASQSILQLHTTPPLRASPQTRLDRREKREKSWHLKLKRCWVEQYNFCIQDSHWGQMFVRSVPIFPFPLGSGESTPGSAPTVFRAGGVLRQFDLPSSRRRRCSRATAPRRQSRHWSTQQTHLIFCRRITWISSSRSV